MLHADPHPGNFRILPNADGTPGRLGVLDFGAVARLPERAPARGDGPPDPDRRHSRTTTQLLAGLRREGVRQGQGHASTRSCCSTTSRPSWSRRRSSGSGSRGSGCGRSSSGSTTRASRRTRWRSRLNLPPSYLLIHRTWLGAIGVLSQLEAEAPFRRILEEHLPGFAEPG